ncbi:MAG TPA: energy transducer TonB [Fusobacterium sp.]|uniref:energy transducer TonB n=1 Tax=Fusobacterium sp. TaxID=68766 RepID=UPI002F4121CC
MTDKNRRFFQGFIVAIIFHLLAAMLLGVFTPLLNQYSPKILEITLEQSGGGKKSGSGEKSANLSGSTNIEKKQSFPSQSDDIIKEKIVEKKKEEKDLKKQKKQLIEQKNSNSAEEGKENDLGQSGEGKDFGNGKNNGNGQGNGEGEGEGNSRGKGSGGAVTPPYLVSYSSPKYPPSVRNLEIEGSVYVKILVATDGGVKNVTLHESSGNKTLDEVAVKEVYHWHFSPAKDSLGNPIACNVVLPVNFVLH